jgi:hypothetical protein
MSLENGSMNQSQDNMVIMQFNMLANGLMDRFLDPQIIEIFARPGTTVQNELNRKKRYFEKLNLGIKQLFDVRNTGLNLGELRDLFDRDRDSQMDQKMDEIQYNVQMINEFEIYLLNRSSEADIPSKRIKNIANRIWRKIQDSLMQGKDRYMAHPVPVDPKIREIEQMIGLVADIFSSKYTDYKTDVDRIQSMDQEICQNIEKFLDQRFGMFKQMVQYHDPWIICLQEDDFDNYFEKDEFWANNYGAVRCKKDPSTAKTLLQKRTGSNLLAGLSEQYVQNAKADGVTILFKKSKFMDPDPMFQNCPKIAEKNKSPYLIKELRRIDNGQKICVICAHLESGREDYNKEELRIGDIDLILQDPEYQRIRSDPQTNLIVCMDGNTPFLDQRRFMDYYGPGNVTEGGKSAQFIESDLLIDGKTISRNTAMYHLMSQMVMDQRNLGIAEPTVMYSVNRLRGPDSNQLAKIFEYEYHCIDHVFYQGNDYELVKTRMPMIRQSKQSDDVKNDTQIQGDEGGDYENLLPDFSFFDHDGNGKKISDNIGSISDHLPVFVTLKNLPMVS